MIDITGINLVAFAKKVYKLSVPQGMGFIHFTPEPLTDVIAEELVTTFKDDKCYALNMDYVGGRACKMTVTKVNGKLILPDTWDDHTDRIYQKLLDHFNIQRTSDTQEHGCACSCIDCQSGKLEEGKET